jgi:hypothetical protein
MPLWVFVLLFSKVLGLNGQQAVPKESPETKPNPASSRRTPKGQKKESSVKPPHSKRPKENTHGRRQSDSGEVSEAARAEATVSARVMC